MSESQNYGNHMQFVTGYHKIGFPMVALPTLWFAWRTVTDFSVDALALLVFAVGVSVAAFYARAFPLGVQDRVIRLEERLRMERVLPDDLKARIGEVRTEHLIGLRFAPDEELADLTRRVLAGELADRKAVKEAVKNWRGDYQRI